jgi:hypothetical protein
MDLKRNKMTENTRNGMSLIGLVKNSEIITDKGQSYSELKETNSLSQYLKFNKPNLNPLAPEQISNINRAKDISGEIINLLFSNNDIDEKTLIKYYEEWLEGLPHNIKVDMQKKGYNACKTFAPYTRYVNERTDIGMDEWMKEHLSEEDFKEWMNVKQRNE